MSEVKERPILFNKEMIKAVLNGSKTQTRRVLQHQSPSADHVICEVISDTCRAKESKVGYLHWQLETDPVTRGPYFKNPYGSRGDQLWVRETFTEGEGIIYKEDWEKSCPNVKLNGFWKPSIFMPRAASRILLEVTNVRIERVQDISEEDAQAEGSRPIDCVDLDDEEIKLIDLPLKAQHRGWKYRNGFAALWESINGNRIDKKTKERLPYAWEDNPWVWVVEFKVLEVKGGQS